MSEWWFNWALSARLPKVHLHGYTGPAQWRQVGLSRALQCTILYIGGLKTLLGGKAESKSTYLTMSTKTERSGDLCKLKEGPQTVYMNADDYIQPCRPRLSG